MLQFINKMLNVQKLIRLRPSYDSKYLQRLSFSICKKCENNYSLLTYQSFNNLKIKCPYQNIRSTMLYSTSAVELVDPNVFEKVCEETLESLTDFFEELIDRNQQFESADVSYSAGVLTVNLGKKYGTYVINRQLPNRQIWLSSPVSGPKRYDYVINDNYWIYKHEMVTLHELLQIEISKILGEKVDFSKCLYSKV